MDKNYKLEMYQIEYIEKILSEIRNFNLEKITYLFEMIKELRGGWSAFWWNVKGNIADVSIKDPYDPYNNRTDLFLESLLQSNWNSGYLAPYEGYEDYKIKRNTDK